MRVLVIGYGSMGRRHTRQALELGCEVGVYDTNRNVELPEGAVRLPSEQGIIRWRAEAGVIATPAQYHRSGVALALMAGARGVFIEKPLAASVEDARAIQNMFAVSGAYAQVGYNWRFHPLVESYQAQRRQTLTAPPAYAQFWVSCDRRTWPGADYADTLLECSHEIDLAQALCGPVAAVDSAETFNPEPLRATGDEGWILWLRHENGCETQLLLDDHSPERPSRGFRIEFPNAEGGYDVGDGEAARRDVEASYAAELNYFLAMTTGRVPARMFLRPATIAEGIAVLTLCESARAAC